MTPREFLEDFEAEDFPQMFGPWKYVDDFDPPHTRSQLRAMRKRGLIEYNEAQRSFRLTMTATNLRDEA